MGTLSRRAVTHLHPKGCAFPCRRLCGDRPSVHLCTCPSCAIMVRLDGCLTTWVFQGLGYPYLPPSPRRRCHCPRHSSVMLVFSVFCVWQPVRAGSVDSMRGWVGFQTLPRLKYDAENRKASFRRDPEIQVVHRQPSAT